MQLGVQLNFLDLGSIHLEFLYILVTSLHVT